MPTTPSVTRSRTAAAMTSRLRDDQPTTSTDDSSATSSSSSSRGRGRGRGGGKRGRALNKDLSQQTLYCKGCGQIGHTVLLCEDEGTSNELALTCSDCTRTHTLNAAEKSLTTNTILCSYHFIQNYVAPGTTIITDKWKAYINLQNHGYVHLDVNHSQNFVDPESGAHTNRIEGTWTLYSADRARLMFARELPQLLNFRNFVICLSLLSLHVYLIHI